MIKLFTEHEISNAHKTRMLKNCFFAIKLTYGVIMLINIKMPTIVGILALISMIRAAIVGILTFMAMLHFMLCRVEHFVHCSIVITCWERAGLLALLCVVFYCVFVTNPYGVSDQVWYLIVSIPDLCLLS